VEHTNVRGELGIKAKLEKTPGLGPFDGCLGCSEKKEKTRFLEKTTGSRVAFRKFTRGSEDRGLLQPFLLLSSAKVLQNSRNRKIGQNLLDDRLAFHEGSWGKASEGPPSKKKKDGGMVRDATYYWTPHTSDEKPLGQGHLQFNGIGSTKRSMTEKGTLIVQKRTTKNKTT